MTRSRATPTALIGIAPCVVMANPLAPIKTMADVEASARKAGQFDSASGGPAPEAISKFCRALITNRRCSTSASPPAGQPGGVTGFVKDRVLALSPTVKGAGVKL